MTTTRRLSGAITETSTPRVPRASLTNSIYDAWGGSWAGAWGLSWLVSLSLATLGHSARVVASVSDGATKRVLGAPAGSVSSRVGFDHFLLLEGDESGFLLLEGDAAGDAMGLEGDETDLGGTTTKRVVQ